MVAAVLMNWGLILVFGVIPVVFICLSWILGGLPWKLRRELNELKKEKLRREKLPNDRGHGEHVGDYGRE